ncbi:MAG TPA: glycosyltransferase [bacterium]|nr:glycosyltransferase [bacterium]HXF82198.1 glycosyltransferase [bacterium]
MLASSNHARSPRVMMYSQDGFGLGHMRRTTSIARQLLALRPDACVLTLADSRLGQFFESSEQHDYLKLPSILKVGPGNWRAVSLPLPFADVHTMRTELIRAAALSYRPDVLLVDHMPHGAMGELLPALEALRAQGAGTQIVLGLRDILDAPETVRRRWEAEGAYEAIERYYDRVLVYGQRDVYDMAAHYGFSPAIAGRMRYTGYVCTPDVARYPARARAKYLAGTAPGTKLLVAMAGGGADAYPMMKALIEALPAIRVEQPCELAVITGPFMPAELRRDLETRARATRGAYVAITVSDPLSYIAAADLVYAMCGYNTTMEIMRSTTPAVLIPRAGPSAEQRTRARLFAERGWMEMVDPDEVSPAAIVDATRRALAQGVVARPRPDGLAAAAAELLALLPAVAPEPLELALPGRVLRAA